MKRRAKDAKGAIVVPRNNDYAVIRECQFVGENEPPVLRRKRCHYHPVKVEDGCFGLGSGSAVQPPKSFSVLISISLPVRRNVGANILERRFIESSLTFS